MSLFIFDENVMFTLPDKRSLAITTSLSNAAVKFRTLILTIC